MRIIAALFIIFSASLSHAKQQTGLCNENVRTYLFKTFHVQMNNQYRCWYGTDNDDFFKVDGTMIQLGVQDFGNMEQIGYYDVEKVNVFFTYDGENTVIGGMGNDIFIGGKDVDYFWGKEGFDKFCKISGEYHIHDWESGVDPKTEKIVYEHICDYSSLQN